MMTSRVRQLTVVALVAPILALLVIVLIVRRDSEVWSSEPYADDDWITSRVWPTTLDGYRRAGCL